MLGTLLVSSEAPEDFNLPNKIKDGAYIINPAEYANIRTPWITLYANCYKNTYLR